MENGMRLRCLWPVRSHDLFAAFCILSEFISFVGTVTDEQVETEIVNQSNRFAMLGFRRAREVRVSSPFTDPRVNEPEAACDPCLDRRLPSLFARDVEHRARQPPEGCSVPRELTSCAHQERFIFGIELTLQDFSGTHLWYSVLANVQSGGTAAIGKRRR